jgi:hypothetical protein
MRQTTSGAPAERTSKPAATAYNPTLIVGRLVAACHHTLMVWSTIRTREITMAFDKVVTSTAGVKWMTIDAIVELTGKTAKSAHQQYFQKFVSSGKFTKKLVTSPTNPDRKAWYIKAEEVLDWYRKQLDGSGPKQLSAPKSVAEQLG